MAYIGTSPSNGVRRVHTYTATASQTTFSGASSEGVTLSYADTNYLDVYQNGILLGSADYTATSGTSVVLTQSASASDLVVIVVYDVFSVADTVSKANGGTFDSAVTMSDNLTVSGAFTSQGIDDNADAVAITIDSSENVGVGETVPLSKLHVKGGDSGADVFANTYLTLENSGDTRMTILSGTSNIGSIKFGDSGLNRQGSIDYVHSDDSMRFATTNTERARISGVGDFQLNGGTTQYPGVGNTANGTMSESSQRSFFVSRADGEPLYVNRNNQDGTIISIRQDGNGEGTISTSGSTTSYNAFSASHWSRLIDNSKPTILKGTVIETIDEMMDWYQAEFTVAETDDVAEYVQKVSIALPNGKNVGDTTSVTFNGITYDNAVIIQEADNKHCKCKISDTADSTRVYGVFADWDNDDDSVNDMYVTAVGTHVVRVNADETVSAGDLLTSNGDGTAKVQDDDIIRSKTIGKVLTNIKQETYDDGSYTVPCALYCG